MPLNLALLETLETVIDSGSFERAARVLRVTQPAISQRIRSLEELFGTPILVRESPLRPTEVGQQLLSYFRKTQLLEEQLFENIDQPHQKSKSLDIAINNDSLYYWWYDAVRTLLKEEQIRLRVRTSDELLTHRLLERGDVCAVISSIEAPPAGCITEELGAVRYHCVATTDFINMHIGNQITLERVLAAPLILFNKYDSLQQEFFKFNFQAEHAYANANFLPNPHIFSRAILDGIGYGLLPDFDFQKAGKGAELVELFPDCSIYRKLYWHSWRVENSSMKKLKSCILQHCAQYLTQL